MDNEISYERWLVERVWMVKLPFKLSVPEVPKEELERKNKNQKNQKKSSS